MGLEEEDAIQRMIGIQIRPARPKAMTTGGGWFRLARAVRLSATVLAAWWLESVAGKGGGRETGAGGRGGASTVLRI